MVMSVIEVGSVCVKEKGREKGKKCVVIDIIDKNYVLVTGPKKATGVKRRRVSINHLSPTGEKVKVKKGASDREVQKVLKK